MEVKVNTLTPELFLDLYTSVGWEAPVVQQVKEALKNTLVTFTTYENNYDVLPDIGRTTLLCSPPWKPHVKRE